MTDTPRFGLTLLEAAQAQKHMTVNEALARLDALAAGRAEALAATAPPPAPAEGEVWGVGSGATGEWAGQEGRLALRLGGGWEFADPWPGLRLFDAEIGAPATYLPDGWVPGLLAAGPSGAGLMARVAEIDHAIAPGATSTTAPAIPDKAVVIGISARVTAEILGASGWSLGVAGAADRYGSGFSPAAGSRAEGVTAQPQAYYGGTSLVLTAEGGDFAGGALRLAVHYLAVSAPAP